MVRGGRRRCTSCFAAQRRRRRSAQRSFGFAPVRLLGCVFVRQWNQCEPVPAVERLNVYNAIDAETGLQADCRKK